jgi:hypothetical protein
LGSQDPGTRKVDPPLDRSKAGLCLHKARNTVPQVPKEEKYPNAKKEKKKDAKKSIAKGDTKITRLFRVNWCRLSVTLPNLATPYVHNNFAGTVQGCQFGLRTLDQIVPSTFFCKTRILIRGALHFDVNSKFKNQNE